MSSKAPLGPINSINSKLFHPIDGQILMSLPHLPSLTGSWKILSSPSIAVTPSNPVGSMPATPTHRWSKSTGRCSMDGSSVVSSKAELGNPKLVDISEGILKLTYKLCHVFYLQECVYSVSIVQICIYIYIYTYIHESIDTYLHVSVYVGSMQILLLSNIKILNINVHPIRSLLYQPPATGILDGCQLRRPWLHSLPQVLCRSSVSITCKVQDLGTWGKIGCQPGKNRMRVFVEPCLGSIGIQHFNQLTNLLTGCSMTANQILAPLAYMSSCITIKLDEPGEPSCRFSHSSGRPTSQPPALSLSDGSGLWICSQALPSWNSSSLEQSKETTSVDISKNSRMSQKSLSLLLVRW